MKSFLRRMTQAPPGKAAAGLGVRNLQGLTAHVVAAGGRVIAQDQRVRTSLEHPRADEYPAADSRETVGGSIASDQRVGQAEARAGIVERCRRQRTAVGGLAGFEGEEGVADGDDAGVERAGVGE